MVSQFYLGLLEAVGWKAESIGALSIGHTDSQLVPDSLVALS